MSIIVHAMKQFDEYIDSMADEKTTSWPIMISASRMIVVILIYIAMVTVIGPKLMENRKPYNLKRIILVYNTFQVIACTTLFTWASRICWWTTLLKLAEFIETVFFVLRKKQNQVSALHVYHHASTLVIIWGSTKLFPSPMVLLPIMINSLVHMLMYIYYLLSAFGPHIQKRIFKWKKYITIIQMVQFCILVTYSMQILLPYCEVPNAYAYIFIPNVFLVFYFFFQFYQQAYTKRAQKKS